MLNYTQCRNIRIDGSYYHQLAEDWANPKDDPFLPPIQPALVPRLPAAYSDADATFDQNVYENGIVMWLEFLRRTRTGWALLMDVWRCRPKEIVIQPWLARAEVNAAKYWKDRNLAAALAPASSMGRAMGSCMRTLAAALGHPQPPPPKTDDPGWLCLEENAATKRVASEEVKDLPRAEALVYFSPEFYSPPGRVYRKPGPGTEADEALLHEMVHAARILRDVADELRNANPPDNPGWDNDEEFFAIVLANVYRSELTTRGWHRPGLRKDHKSGAALEPKFADPKVFLGLGLNPLRFQRWSVEQKELFQDVRQVRCPFNPIRAFFGDPVP
jgi:hypothetical protein